jgi:protein-L-isoaspartate(D-aspartate) O-methyltransferase
MVDRQIRPSDVNRYPIIAALLHVPREVYVPDALKPVAYLGEQLPLAPSRVILEPRTFALLLQHLELGPQDLVLDVGCGLGYSTAVIARLAEAVIGVEEDEDLARQAEERLAAQGVDNAALHFGPLAAGDPGHGPYDAIVIEGGIGRLPEALADQLKPGGRIVAILAEEGYGHARIGIKTATGIAWRRIFDAAAPVLPGFERAKAFEF